MVLASLLQPHVFTANIASRPGSAGSGSSTEEVDVGERRAGILRIQRVYRFDAGKLGDSRDLGRTNHQRDTIVSALHVVEDSATNIRAGE